MTPSNFTSSNLLYRYAQAKHVAMIFLICTTHNLISTLYSPDTWRSIQVSLQAFDGTILTEKFFSLHKLATSEQNVPNVGVLSL